MRHPLSRCVRTTALVVVVLVGLLPGVANAQAAPDPSLGELSAAWWKWAVQSWTAEAEQQSDCPAGSFGTVALLAGSPGGTVTRRCTVAEGTSLLIPVINAAWSEAEGDCPVGTSAKIEDPLAACAAALMDLVTVAKVTGTIRDVEPQRVSFGRFDIEPVEGNVFGIPAGSTVAFADGYWLHLTSLPVGRHTIVVHGRIPDFNFQVRVVYQITVVPS